MTHGVQQQRDTRRREPFKVQGRRVPGGYVRTTADGVETFEYRGKLAGQFANRKLTATNRTDAAAEIEQLRAEARVADAPVRIDRRLTVAELANRYRAAIDLDPTLSPKSCERMHTLIRLHVEPKLGRVKACELDSATVARWARALPRSMRAKTHRNVVSALSSMLGWATVEGLLAENSVRVARERFPRDLKRHDASPFEARVLTADEEAAVLAKLGDSYRPVLAFMMATGARVSEALGVRFGDIDLKAETWTVAGQLLNGEVRPAKTPGSMTTVPLSTAAVAVVKAQREALAEERGFLAIAADAFVFVGKTGNPHDRHNTRRAFKAALRQALGEETAAQVRLHDTRGGFVSALAEKPDVDLPTVQLLARHANLSTTVNVYTRVRGNDEAKLARMRAALGA
jgi:integrase